jgi:hypothetical protein
MYFFYSFFKEFYNELVPKKLHGRHWWLTPVILVTWESEIRRITVLGQPSQKEFCETSSQQKKGRVWWCICHPSYSRQSKIGGSQARLDWANSEILSLK